jgi:TRAP-type C4-dicarboxylate transport system substrate-binding protein
MSRRASITRGLRHRVLGALAGLGLIASMTGCVQEASSTGQVPAELAGMEPVTLRVPTLYGPGHYQTEALQEYADAVAKDSGGSIKLELYYQDSLVAPEDTVAAMRDGLVDLSLIVPGYTPSDFPIDVWTSYFAFPNTTEPVVELLHSTAAVMEWAFEQPDMMAEYDRLGLVPIVPRFTGHDAYNLLCREPVTTLAEAKGQRGRVGGPNWAAEIQAVGMVPVSLAGGEIYEGFQRGVIDCHVGSGPDMAGLGLWEVGKHYTTTNFSGFSSGGLMMARTKWEALPLAAQQILWDNAMVYVAAWQRGWIAGMREFVLEGKQMGVQFHQPDARMRESIAQYQEQVIASAAEDAPEEVSNPQQLVTSFRASFEKWLPIVDDQLGYSTDTGSWEKWAESTEENPDLDKWAEYVQREVLDPRRPE